MSPTKLVWLILIFALTIPPLGFATGDFLVYFWTGNQFSKIEWNEWRIWFLFFCGFLLAATLRFEKDFT